MNLKKVGLVAPVLALLAYVPAAAQTATTNVSVTASIANTCTITNATVALGVYDPVVTNAATPLDGSGSVTITCTRGALTSVSLGLGANVTGTQRRMNNGVPNYMNYELYQPPSNTPATACTYASPTVWGTAGANLFVPAAAPSTAARTYNICGRIPGGQDLPSGSYADTVVATVNF